MSKKETFEELAAQGLTKNQILAKLNMLPPAYKTEYCKKVTELGKKGLTKTQIASAIDVPMSIIKSWVAAYDEFNHAWELSSQYSQAHWESLAQQHIIEVPQGPKLNTALWNKSMASRFPDYNDKTKVELTGKDGNPIEIESTVNFAQELMDDFLSMRQADAESSDS